MVKYLLCVMTLGSGSLVGMDNQSQKKRTLMSNPGASKRRVLGVPVNNDNYEGQNLELQALSVSGATTFGGVNPPPALLVQPQINPFLLNDDTLDDFGENGLDSEARAG